MAEYGQADLSRPLITEAPILLEGAEWCWLSLIELSYYLGFYPIITCSLSCGGLMLPGGDLSSWSASFLIGCLARVPAAPPIWKQPTYAIALPLSANSLRAAFRELDDLITFLLERLIWIVY